MATRDVFINLLFVDASQRVRVDSLMGREALSELFRYSLQVDMDSLDYQGTNFDEPETLLEETVRLEFVKDGTTIREIDGIIVYAAELPEMGRRARRHGAVGSQWTRTCFEVERDDERLRHLDNRLVFSEYLEVEQYDAPRGKMYELTLVPRHWALTRNSRTRSYQSEAVLPGQQTDKGQTLAMVLQAVLENAGFTDQADFNILPWGLDDGEKSWLGMKPDDRHYDFVLQYQETDWNFICRLAEHAGIALYFDRHNDSERLVLADGLPDATPSTLTCDYTSPRCSVTVGRCAVDDYAFTVPAANLKSEETLTTGLGEAIEYGAHYSTTIAAQELAKRRGQEQSHQKVRLRGVSSDPLVTAGAALTIGTLAEQRVLWVKHTLMDGYYTNTFESFPAGEVYRPERVTPRPKIAGLLSGTVEREAADSWGPRLDANGHYAIRLKCDSDTTSAVTLFVRKAQLFSHHAGGAGGGAHHALLPDTEVLVGFENGDPDRPVIVSAAPRQSERTVVRTDLNNGDRSVYVSPRQVKVQSQDAQGNDIEVCDLRPGVVIQVR